MINEETPAPAVKKKRVIRKNGTPAKKPGRKTNKQRLEAAIKKANSEELETSLGTIRAKMVQRLHDAASDDGIDRVGAAEDIKAMHELWKKGKDILDDIKREELARQQTHEYHKQVLGYADAAIKDLGWVDDGD